MMRATLTSLPFAIALFLPGIAHAQATATSPDPAPSASATLIPSATPPSTTPGASAAAASGVTDQTPANAEPKPAPNPSDGFQFGSYGRVQIASDGRGGTGRPANVVAHGTRIDEDSYAELELRREDTFQQGDATHPEIHTKVVATLAFFPPFFHFSGDQMQEIGRASCRERV